MPIARLAEEVGWSHKPLIARFRHQLGLRPKTAARLVRFEGVLGRLDERRGLDWGLVAREAGYADQAHLIRDFHQFTGATPTDPPPIVSPTALLVAKQATHRKEERQ